MEATFSLSLPPKIRHSVSASILYMAGSLSLFGFANADLVDKSTAIAFTVISTGWSVVILYLICSGISRAFKDSALTSAQVVFGISLILWLNVESPKIAPALFIFTTVPLMYGTLGLKKSSFAGLTAATMMGVLAGGVMHTFAGKSSTLEWVCLGIAMVTMPFVSSLCSVLASMREQLVATNKRLIESHAEIKEYADKDTLTGLYTRRRINERAEYLANLAKRGDSLCVAIIDIDHFKLVNDTYGHPTGDAVLTKIANVVSRCVRNTDVVGRWGGEEFIVLIHGNIHSAETICARIRNEVSCTSISELGTKNITVSIGVASYENQEHFEDTILRADSALYEAKNSGRNNVVLWREKEADSIIC
jgi:diguanylate cyclase (GGDEF)-like protein